MFEGNNKYIKNNYVLRWVIGVSFSLVVVLFLYVFLGWVVVLNTYGKCGNRILDNEGEAIGAVKNQIVWDTDSKVDFIKIIEPVEFFDLGDIHLEYPAYWKVIVDVGPDKIKPKIYRVYYVTICAEVYGIEDWGNGIR